MTVVNVRGCNGSGKTFIVMEFMKRFGPPVPIYTPDDKIEGYVLSNGIQIVGRYTSKCSGCDVIRTMDEVEARVERYARRGHVLFEGVIVSSLYARFLDLSRRLGGMWWAYLDTPLEVCLERIAERNQDKPFNHGLVESKYRTCQRQLAKLMHTDEKVIVLDHQNPVEMTLKLFKGR